MLRYSLPVIAVVLIVSSFLAINRLENLGSQEAAVLGGISKDNLEAYWSFDNKDLKDTSPDYNANKTTSDNATCFGTSCPSFDTTQKIGDASIKFDGVNDWMEFPEVFKMDKTMNWSISLWFRLDALPSQSNDMYLWKYTDTTEYGDSFLYVDDDNRIKAWNDHENRKLSTAVTVTTGTWYHVVGVMSGTGQTNGDYKIYVNGELAAEDTSWEFTTPGTGSFEALKADGRAWGKGNIDDISLWNKPLSATEVGALYQAGLGTDDTPPSVPQDLSLVTSGQTTVGLVWSASTDAESGIDHYNLYRDGVKITQPSGNDYLDTGLSAGTSYSYQVAAVNGAGLESAKSQSIQVTTMLAVVSGSGSGGSTYDNLQAYWNFDNEDLVDVSSHFNTGKSGLVNATCSGISCPSFDTTNKQGVASVQFDGLNDWLQFPEVFNMSKTTNWSVSEWFRLDALPSERNDMYLWKYTDSNEYGDSFLYIDDDNKIKAWSDADNRKLSTGVSVEKGKWYHVVGVRSGAAPRGDYKIYVNGMLKAEDTGWEFGTPGTGSFEVFKADGRAWGKGNIDDISLWNKPLSPAEVQDLYANGIEAGVSTEPLNPTPLDTTVPSVPGSLKGAASSETSISLTWSASTDAESGIDHYNLYRDGVKITQPSGNDYLDTGLSAGTSYSYQVAAVNGAGLESAKSSNVNVTTDSAPVSSAPSPSPSTFTLYDGTIFLNKPKPVIDSRLKPVSVIYANQYWPSGGDRSLPPDPQDVYALGTKYKNIGYFSVHDLEAFYGDPNQMQWYTDISQEFQSTYGNGMVSHYGVLPAYSWNIIPKGPGSEAWTDWQKTDDEWMASVGKYVNVFSPSFYTYANDPARWVAWVKATVAEARRLNPNYPVIPFIWPFYHQAAGSLAGTQVPQDFWKLQLDTLSQIADGVVIWGGYQRQWESDDGLYSDWWRVTREFLGDTITDTTPPSVPQNLTDTAVSESGVTLSWDKSSDHESGMDHYNVYRNGSKVGESTELTYADAGLSASTAYTYQVTAVNQKGLESAKSTSLKVTTSAGTQFDPKLGLIGYWSLDGSSISGLTAADSSGNGHNGTLTGFDTVSIVSGMIGDAVDFTGLGKYVSVPSVTSDTFANRSFTWAAWVKGTTAYDTNNMPSIGFGSSAWPRLGFKEGSGIWTFMMIKDGTEKQTVTCGNSSATAWTHLAIVAAYGGNISCYRNGQLVDAKPYVNDVAVNGPFGIGRAGITYSGWNEDFRGPMDEIRLYNRALSDTEVLELYAMR